MRDEVVRFVQHWAKRAHALVKQLLRWLGIPSSKYYNWKKRLGRVNAHNSKAPRGHWLQEWEKKAILSYEAEHPEEGYRRLTYMMLDAGVVAASPSSVYRVLKNAGRIGRKKTSTSTKGTGFSQPCEPHEHWHIDISYLNISGTFYYLCSVLDGYSRYIVHWEIRESMKEADVEAILHRAYEQFPTATPRIISDNGPQFVARDFKVFIRECGMTHVRTSPYYPQSNGKIERWHGTLKQECIRPKTPLTLDDALRVVGQYVTYYNDERLHSGIGYVTPKDRLEGRDPAVWATRRQKLAKAREDRKTNRTPAGGTDTAPRPQSAPSVT